MPKICIERGENPDGSQFFLAKIKSIPEPYHVQWKVKRNGQAKFSFIDVNNPEYKGTSNSIHCPVLVVKKKELLKNQSFYIKVDNFIGSSIKEIFGKNISLYELLISFVILLYTFHVFLEIIQALTEYHLHEIFPIFDLKIFCYSEVFSN